jgi:hypothetical protein
VGYAAPPRNRALLHPTHALVAVVVCLPADVALGTALGSVAAAAAAAAAAVDAELMAMSVVTAFDGSAAAAPAADVLLLGHRREIAAVVTLLTVVEATEVVAAAAAAAVRSEAAAAAKRAPQWGVELCSPSVRDGAKWSDPGTTHTSVLPLLTNFEVTLRGVMLLGGPRLHATVMALAVGASARGAGCSVGGCSLEREPTLRWLARKPPAFVVPQ